MPDFYTYIDKAAATMVPTPLLRNYWPPQSRLCYDINAAGERGRTVLQAAVDGTRRIHRIAGHRRRRPSRSAMEPAGCMVLQVGLYHSIIIIIPHPLKING